MVVPHEPDGEADEPERSRGQLVLIGAIGIGFVIVGLVVVINTSLISENIAASESLQNTDEVTRFSTIARVSRRAFVIRINHEQRNLTATEISTAVRSNLSIFSRALAESYARTGVAVVNVSYNNDSSEWGTRLVQVNDSELASPNGAFDWRIFKGTSARPNVRRFVLNLNVTDTSDKEFNITFINQTGGYVNMSFRKNNDKIEIRTERTPGGNVTGVACDPSGRRVLVNVVSGKVYTGNCNFNGVVNRTDPSRTLEPPYRRVQIKNGDRAGGKFSLVTNLSYSQMGSATRDYKHCDPAYTGPVGLRTNPCRSPALWRANITTRFQSRSSDYWQLHNVSVYP